MSESDSPSPTEMFPISQRGSDQDDVIRKPSTAAKKYYQNAGDLKAQSASDTYGVNAARSSRSGAPSPPTNPATSFDFRHEELASLFMQVDGLELSEGAYYFSYATQHLVMTTCQQILEEACFDYIKAGHPDLIRNQNCDCASALDLPRWLKIFSDSPSLADLVRSLPPLTLDEVRSVRDIAVHRPKITARGISLTLRSVEKFLRALRDVDRTSKVGVIERQIQSRIDSMEYEIEIAKRNCADSLEEIAEKRKRVIRDWAERQEEVKQKASREINHVVHAVSQRKQDHASDTGNDTPDPNLVSKSGKSPYC